MFQRQPCCASMIQNDIRDAFDAMVSGNSNCRQWQRVFDGGIYSNEPFNATIHQNVRICLKEFWVVTMGNRQEEEVLLAQVTLNAADDQRSVGITNFLGHHPNHVGALCPQVESVKTGPVI